MFGAAALIFWFCLLNLLAVLDAVFGACVFSRVDVGFLGITVNKSGVTGDEIVAVFVWGVIFVYNGWLTAMFHEWARGNGGMFTPAEESRKLDRILS